MMFLERFRGKKLEGSDFTPPCWMYMEVSCIWGFEWSLCIVVCWCVCVSNITALAQEGKLTKPSLCYSKDYQWLLLCRAYTVCTFVYYFTLHVACIFVLWCDSVWSLIWLSLPYGRQRLTDKSWARNLKNIEFGDYDLILNRAKKNLFKSPCERLRESHSQTSRHILCQRPQCPGLLHLDLTVCTLAHMQVLRMKLATMRRLYVSKGCENIPVIAMENSLSCHLMWEILWVRLQASACYSGTILLCLFSETVDV